ncbi:hypothetical protein HDU76_011082, partial [Blyttiomyces sp. JEL0837]
SEHWDYWKVENMTTIDEIRSRLNTTWKVDGLLNAMEYGSIEAFVFLITLLESHVELVEACETVLNVALGPGGMQGFVLNTTLQGVGDVLMLFEGVDVELVKRSAIDKGHGGVVEFLVGLE